MLEWPVVWLVRVRAAFFCVSVPLKISDSSLFSQQSGTDTPEGTPNSGSFCLEVAGNNTLSTFPWQEPGTQPHLDGKGPKEWGPWLGGCFSAKDSLPPKPWKGDPETVVDPWPALPPLLAFIGHLFWARPPIKYDLSWSSQLAFKTEDC